MERLLRSQQDEATVQRGQLEQTLEQSQREISQSQQQVKELADQLSQAQKVRL